MKKLLFLLGVCLTLAGCSPSPSPETHFSRDGITFTCPNGWQIKDEENLDGLGYSLSVEKDGFSSSGLIMVNWINIPMDEEMYMETYREELGNNVIYKNAGMAFTDNVPGEYAGHPTLTCTYTASIMGVDHRGTLHILTTEDKTITLCIQEATEDIEKNAVGFEKVETTFKIAATDE